MNNLSHTTICQPSSQSCRLVYLDYARVFVAILVIVGHLMDYKCNGRNYILSFHMPFFFLVSGMLHKEKSDIQWQKLCKTLLRPMFIYIGIYIVISSFFFHYDFWHFETVYKTQPADSVLCIIVQQMYLAAKGFVFSGRLANGPCWFLLVLFLCKAFMGLYSLTASNIFKGGVICFYCIVFLICTIAACKYDKRWNLFYIGQTAMVFPFFFIGYKYKEKIQRCLTAGLWRRLLVVVLLGFTTIMLCKYNGHVSTYSPRFGSHNLIVSLPIFYVNALAGTFMMLFVSTLFKKVSLITNLANSLITILTVQLFFCFTVRFSIGWVEHMDMILLARTIVISIIILMLCHIIHLFIFKHFKWIYGK